MIKKTSAVAFIFVVFVLFLFSGCSKDVESSEKEPKDIRIVSQLPSLTEICFTLGLAEQVVGVTDFCRYPPDAALKPKIGGIINPSYEKVVSLRPDLILVQENQTDQIKKYKELNLNVLAMKVRSIEDVYDSILKIGKAAGRDKKANMLVTGIKAQFAAVKEKYKNKKSQRALLVVGHDPGSLESIFVAGKNTFLSQILEMVGGINVINDNQIAFPTYSKEEIIKRSPEVILVISERSVSFAEDLTHERKLWSQIGYIDAVKNDRIYLLQEEYMLIPGPRMGKVAEDMAHCMFDQNQSEKAGGEK